ncbi:MAG: glycine betaine ABC transporter substrate-binding protein [Acidimicrobiales bacterium]
MRRHPTRVLIAGLVGLALVTAACGSDDDDTTEGATQGGKGSLTIGSTNFTENVILAHIYGGALRSDGFTVTVRPNLGSRELVAPALDRGELDLYIGYAATELEFYNNSAGQATPNAKETVEKLRAQIQGKGLTALEPSSAVDQNAFGITQATADRLKLKKLSDVPPVAGDLTLGGPSECPTRPFCAKGLEDKYGIRFKSFRPLDAGGPLTKGALRSGEIDVGLLLSSDAKGFVLLEDDKGLQNADNVVPVIRTDKATPEVRTVLDKVSAALTTEELSALNERANVDKDDPDAVAQDWLKENGF